MIYLKILVMRYVYKSTGYYNQTVKVRFFKRFDEVVVTDMSKHAGKGAMDTTLGT